MSARLLAMHARHILSELRPLPLPPPTSDGWDRFPVAQANLTACSALPLHLETFSSLPARSWVREARRRPLLDAVKRSSCGDGRRRPSSSILHEPSPFHPSPFPFKRESIAGSSPIGSGFGFRSKRAFSSIFSPSSLPVRSRFPPRFETGWVLSVEATVRRFR